MKTNKYYKQAADLIEKSINDLLEKQEGVVLAIPGGRSVTGIFDILKTRNIPWEKVFIFMVDERQVSIDHKDSNYKLAKESFLAELVSNNKIPERNIHPYYTDKGTDYYEMQLKRHGGKYDIVLLSSGEDGHIAALYPNHHSIKDDSEFFITMDDSPKLPKERMSSSRKLLLKSQIGIILFLGEGKQEAYDLFRNKEDYISCPAKLIKEIKEYHIITDLK